MHARSIGCRSRRVESRRVAGGRAHAQVDADDAVTRAAQARDVNRHLNLHRQILVVGMPFDAPSP